MSKPDWRIEFKAQTLAKAKRKAAKGAAKLKELRTPHKRIAVFLDQWAQQNFRSEGGKVGGWLPFKAGGRKVNGVIDPSAKLLMDTRALSISHIAFSSGRNAGIGSDLPYSKAHEKGLGHVPQRRTLPVIGDVRKDIKDIFNQHVKEYKRFLRL